MEIQFRSAPADELYTSGVVTLSLPSGRGSTVASTSSANPTAACEPSQNGLFDDAPHRHSTTRLRTG